MEFIDLSSASEDERFQVKGILSNVSRNLEFACGNKLKVNSKERVIANGNQKEQNIKKSINQQHITEQAQSNNYKNVNGNHYNYNYSNNNNLHHGIDEDNHYSNSIHYHHNNHQAHYSHHHSSQHHNNHYNNVQNNHNNRKPPVISAYSTPFIHGHPVTNGAIQQDSHYKMSYQPQYPSLSKPFYPSNVPNGPHFTNVITSIPPIAASLGTAPPTAISTNGVVSSNQMSDVLAQSDITGQNPHLRSNPNTINENVIVSSYQIPAGYTSVHAPANSFMPAQYISAHPSAHFTPHPMFYLPLHMTQIYPSHYPPHLGNPQPATILTAPHQQLATPPISPQQIEEFLNADDYLNEDVSKNLETENLTSEKNVNKEKNMQSSINNQSSLSTYSFTSDKNKSKSSLNSNEKFSEDEKKKNSLVKDINENDEINQKNSLEISTLREKESSLKNQEKNASLNESNQSINSSEENFFDSSNKENLSSSVDNLEISSTIKEELIDSKLDLNNTENKEEVIDKSKSNAKSWADLFKSGNLNYQPSIIIGINDYQQKDNSLFNTDDFTPLSQHLDLIKKHPSQLTIKTVSLEEDEHVLKLLRKIKDINLKHSLPLLIPRGFTNDGNWCYINSILQALLYCPPFYNLMREIGETPGIFREKSATPVIDSFAKFFTNFMPNEQLMRKVKSSSSFGYEDLPKLEPYEPKCIYNVLGNINNECLKGKQEDAEEFFSSVLNCLHKEMILLLNYDQKNNQNKIKTNIKKNEDVENSSEEEKWSNQDNDLKWKEVKTKHKTLATNNCKIIDTPITDIFGGTMLFIRTAGKDINYNRQPFFSLKLDIQSDKIRTVEDALKNLTLSESIHGYTCPKTNKIIDASCQTFLDQLPAILVLHLKLHTEKDGQLRKSLKKIDFPIVLEMPKECLTTQERSKYSKTYKLLAVVHHDGKDTAKGHYFTDIYHIGTSLWLRCNDSSIEAINVQQLMHPQNSKVPYLLFYRRCDTLRNSSKSLTVIS